MNKQTLAATTLAVGAAAGIGSVASRPRVTRWYSRLRKPGYVPPNAVFSVAWTSLYTDIAITSATAIDRLRAAGRQALAFATRDQCGVKLAEFAQAGDRVVIMGARDDTLSVFAAELLAKLP